ncbi:MAG: hypothetical protein HKO53_01360 [Gemmatimonadetes bacterium]|nr:hypothetical protein [Gemmatimonadota bacterium]
MATTTKVTLSATCLHCGKTDTVEATQRAVDLYRAGAKVQHAFGDKDPQEREIAIAALRTRTYYCQDWWDAAGEED